MRYIKKVTDPKEKVTDPQVLEELRSQRIDPKYVKLWHDYAPAYSPISGKFRKQYSPFAKFYRDLKSTKRIMVVSGLPMVKVKGKRIEPAWFYSTGKDKWYSRANLFNAIVDGRQIKLTCLSDQPYGAKKGDSVTYSPQLFLDGIEIQPVSEYPIWLEIDPTNKNYHQNVLEWNYGICTYRLRIIEGRIHGRWLFLQKPDSTIRIKYNQQGNFKLKLRYAINDDEELVTSELFDEIYEDKNKYEISDSATYYPDASPETSSLDGILKHSENPSTWAVIKAGAGTDSNTTDTEGIAKIKHSSTTDRFNYYIWCATLFATSGLPDNCTISAATLGYYGILKATSGGLNQSYNVCACNPASDIALEAGDYDTRSFIEFATAIAYSAWNTTGFNTFTFNATGRASISKTGVSKYAFLNVDNDIGDSAPAWTFEANNSARSYSSEQGVGFKPKLIVTYDVAGGKAQGYIIG